MPFSKKLKPFLPALVILKKRQIDFLDFDERNEQKKIALNSKFELQTTPWNEYSVLLSIRETTFEWDIETN